MPKANLLAYSYSFSRMNERMSESREVAPEDYRREHHTVDYDPVIKSQLAFTQLTLGSYAL